jgi:O-antigen/teichoic acid export membrane protein
VRDQQLLQAAAAALALPLLGLLLQTRKSPLVSPEIRVWFFGLLVIELVSQEAMQNLIALSRPLTANFVVFVRQGLWAYPVIALVAVKPQFRSLWYLLAAWSVGGCLSIVLAGWSLRDLAWRRALVECFDLHEMFLGLRIAAPYIVITGASMGLLFLDRFFLEAYHGLEAVGIYTFFAGLTTSLHTLVNTGVSVIQMPRLVETYNSRSLKSFHREVSMLAKMTVGSSLVLALALSLAIFPALRFVGKPIYRENVGVFFALLAAAVARCAADVPIYSLYAKRQDAWILGVQLAAFGTSVGMNLLLVPRFSIHGAAASAVAASVVLLGSAIAANAPTRSNREHRS